MARRGLCVGGYQGIGNLHHAMPMFLGGLDVGSNLIEIPAVPHAKLHQVLHYALKLAMLPGTANAEIYNDIFNGEVGGKSERELVQQIVLAVAREFDKKCKSRLNGLSLEKKVADQIKNGEWSF